MKKFLLGAAAAVAVAAPGFAAADTNAVVGVQYSNSEIESFDWDSYGINGAFSHTFNSGMVLQFDGAADRVDAGGCCVSNGYAALHYGVRNDSHGFGGFVTLEDFFGFSGAGVGLEGQLFLNNLIFNGSVGYTDFSDLDFEVVNAQVDGAYYFTPNLALTGLIGYAEDEGAFDEDWVTYGIGGEWRFSGSPASVELGYRTTEIDDDDIDSWMIGFNFDLGTGSLHERATSGPSFNGASALHDTFGVVLP